MTERILLVLGFALIVTVVWWTAMHTTPGRGFHCILEKAAHGILMCLVCYLLLLPFGFKLAQTPASALMGGYLGLPGIALCTFLSMWP